MVAVKDTLYPRGNHVIFQCLKSTNQCGHGRWERNGSTVAAPAQQNKMKAFNDQANAKGFGERKGEERRVFMKECLSAKSTKSGGGKETQQNKMKACNKEAGEKNLKGDERKHFMSDCLSDSWHDTSRATNIKSAHEPLLISSMKENLHPGFPVSCGARSIPAPAPRSDR